MGENVGNLIAVSLDGNNTWDDGYADFNGTEVLDNEALGFIVVAGFKASDMFSFESPVTGILKWNKWAAHWTTMK